MKFITTPICPLFAPLVLRASIVDSDAINSHQEELAALLQPLTPYAACDPCGSTKHLSLSGIEASCQDCGAPLKADTELLR